RRERLDAVLLPPAEARVGHPPKDPRKELGASPLDAHVVEDDAGATRDRAAQVANAGVGLHVHAERYRPVSDRGLALRFLDRPRLVSPVHAGGVDVPSSAAASARTASGQGASAATMRACSSTQTGAFRIASTVSFPPPASFASSSRARA